MKKPQEEMNKIGQMFKAKREEMHLSLKEVENVTSIRKNYLNAIEEGNITNFLSAVYALGFIRQYAVFLGFDGDKIIKENSEAFKIPLEKQEFAYGLGTLDVRGTPSGSLKWLPNIFWVLIAIGVLVIAWFFAKFLNVF